MASRYLNRKKVINNSKFYSDFFRDRKVKYISQYLTPKAPYMDVEDRMTISKITHVWGRGDRYYKLASKYYSDPVYWWVIGWYNQKPLESDVVPGSVIYIPVPLDNVLTFYYQGVV